MVLENHGIGYLIYTPASVLDGLPSRGESVQMHTYMYVREDQLAPVSYTHLDVKIYLTASVEERAKRRCLELEEKGIPADLEKIKEDIRTRDHQDMNRSIAPLKKAEDAVVVDSSKLSIPEVRDCIVAVSYTHLFSG